MSQRYFITAEATYESLRERLDSQLGYPNALGKSVVQTPLHAPRDSYRRVLLAVDDGIVGDTTIIAAIVPLLASEAMEELDEATYLAAVASASQGGGGGVSSWNDLTDKPATFPPSAHTHVAADITDFGAAVAAAAAVSVRSDTVGSTSYIGRAASGSATSASVWKIRRTILTSAGAISSTATATNVAWDDRLTATYS